MSEKGTRRKPTGRVEGDADFAFPRGERPRLEARVEADLVNRAQRGDQAARERLVVELNPFVRWLAARYETPSLPLEDLVQDGTIGLLRAIEKFDPSRSTRLTTFAKLWIEGEMGRSVRESSLVRLPAEKALALTRLRRAEEQIGDEPSIEALAEALQISTEEVLEMSSMTRALITDEDLDTGPSAEYPGPLDTEEEANYSQEEIENLLAAYAEHRGRLEGTKPTERPAMRSKRSDGSSSPLHARLLDLEDALSRLPDDLFEAVELVAFYGLPPSEAAQWLGGVHPNTARNRYAAAVRAIVDHLNGVKPLSGRRRRGSWTSELSPVESLRLVVRKYESFLEQVAVQAASGDPFWEGMEIGWVLHEDEGWVPLVSRDVRRTARAMRRDVRPLSEALGTHKPSA